MHSGGRHRVKESRCKPAPAEGFVGQHLGDYIGLCHQKHCQCGVQNIFTVPADAIYTDLVAGVAFQHDINVNGLGVNSGECVEDPRLAG